MLTLLFKTSLFLSSDQSDSGSDFVVSGPMAASSTPAISPLWSIPWVPPVSDGQWTTDNLDQVYHQATIGLPVTQLYLKGQTVIELADKLHDHLMEYACLHDFTTVMAPDANFM